MKVLIIFILVALVGGLAAVGAVWGDAQYREYQIQLADAQFVGEQLQVQLTEQQTANTGLRGQLADLRSLNDGQSAELQVRQGLIDALDGQKTNLTADLQEQQRQAAVLAENNRTLTQQRDSLNVQVQESARKLQDNQSVIRSLQQENQSQAALLQAQWQQGNTWDSEKVSLGNEVQRLQGLLNQGEQEVSVAYDTIQTLQQENFQQFNALQQVDQNTRALQAQVQADPGCLDGNQNYNDGFLQILQLLIPILFGL